TFNCSRPATDPGAPPPYSTSASVDGPAKPNNTDTGKLVLGRTPATIWPSTTPGSASPPPVPNIVIVDPLRAGFDGELYVPSSFRIAPWPRPEPSRLKIPGRDASTGTVTASERTPAYSTWTSTDVCPDIA